MFDETARYYDKIYAFKDYASEADRVASILHEQIGERCRLLDVACGTGSHLVHLRELFEVEGLDRSEALLAVARERLPGVRLHRADMRTFELRSQFDAITCLFSSIGYLTTLDDVERAIRAMAAHLAPGGVLIVEPWFTPDQWMPNTVHATLVDEPELKIARVSTSRVDGRISSFDLHHLIGTPDGTEHVVEHHALGLYTVDEMTAAFEAVGLAVDFNSEGLTGRGLYVARKGVS